MYAGHQVIPRPYEQIQRRVPERRRNLATLVENCSSMIVSNSLRPLRQAGAVAGVAGLCNVALSVYVAFMCLFFRQEQSWTAAAFGDASSCSRSDSWCSRLSASISHPRGSETTPALLPRRGTSEQHHDQREAAKCGLLGVGPRKSPQWAR